MTMQGNQKTKGEKKENKTSNCILYKVTSSQNYEL